MLSTDGTIMMTFIYWASTSCHSFHMGIHSSPLHQSSVRSGLHDGPHDHCLLVFVRLLAFPTFPQNYSVWPTEHSTVMASHFQGHAIKTHGFHLALSWIIYSGGSQLLCHEDIHAANWEAHEARNWRGHSPWGGHLGDRSSSPGEPSDDWSSSWHLPCPEPELPS